MTPPMPSDYSDDRLLAFLRRKLAGEQLLATAATHFHDVDIYAADPAILTSVHEPAPAKKGDGDSWFFFTHVKPKSSRDTRKSRQVAGGVGTWHSERAPRAVFDDEGNCIGHFQYFSYKIKTGKNSSERTQWYMVEFSDDDQQGNHDRIHGGEPVLVLCKIYKAHSNSSSRSSTARKRKPTDELLNQVSSPVKAKRRLFDYPAPISMAAASQEPFLCSGLLPKPSHDEEAKHEELETLQEKLSSRVSYNFQLQGNNNATLDSVFRLEDKASESIIQRFWTKAETGASEEQELSQEKLLQDKSNTTLDSAFKSELEPSQDKVSESIIQRFWTSETEASQVDKSSMNCSFLMSGGALPMRAHCAPEVTLSSPSWIGNDITASCSSELGWFVSPAPPMPAHCAPRALSSASWINDIMASCSSELGCVVGAPTYNELGGIAGGRFTGEPDMRIMPFAHVPLAPAASWIFSGPDIWSC
ncbi:unnamed protein product [Miscanthus lutarioriparius]|uniref:NAC domain-containing protein n=1 Tax=Miscanthus lutarioriparius TaxID=422564 RepID=A0A811RPC4_9POAL|nr:unnamed protein product [Miscanthus lutarioriparius]